MNDLTMITHSISSPSITVIPISDVHVGAVEHNEKAWKEFCSMVEKDPNMYITLGGDLVNNSIRSSVGNPFDELLRPKDQKKKMVEYLKPIKDKILCAVSGNHEARTKKEADMDITYDILAKLDIEHLYRENAAFLKLSLGKVETPNRDMAKVSFAGCVTHGSGGGIYTGATVNRNERFGHIIEGLDFLFVGHTHKGTVSRPAKIVLDTRNNKVTMRTITVVSSESWMNFGGYAMKKMLLPSETSNPQKVKFSGRYDNKKIEVVW